jgi:hypothetical protein
MNVFVLCTGRCGSTTFTRACSHITNFTSGHETRASLIGKERFDYPDRHIEADNRLSWMLGRLDREFGDSAYYVHLFRNPEAVAVSTSRRRHGQSLTLAYRHGILKGARNADFVEVCRDQVDTILCNISSFLKDKSHWMSVSLDNAPADFARFWSWIGASGDLGAATREWSVRYNASRRKDSLGEITGRRIRQA